MSQLTPSIGQLQGFLDRMRAGDDAARHELLAAGCQRVGEIASKMLRRFPRVRRWEDSDDILQNVVIRLMRTLEQLRPESVRDFLRLASLQTRRELLDMVKHYYGPRGPGKLHETHDPDSTVRLGNEDPAAGPSSYDPSHLAMWTDFHRMVEELPDDEREVFDFHWYQGLTQEQVAELTGTSVRTVKRRWQSARLRLYDALEGRLPDGGGPF